MTTSLVLHSDIWQHQYGSNQTCYMQYYLYQQNIITTLSLCDTQQTMLKWNTNIFQHGINHTLVLIKTLQSLYRSCQTQNSIIHWNDTGLTKEQYKYSYKVKYFLFAHIINI